MLTVFMRWFSLPPADGVDCFCLWIIFFTESRLCFIFWYFDLRPFYIFIFIVFFIKDLSCCVFGIYIFRSIGFLFLPCEFCWSVCHVFGQLCLRITHFPWGRKQFVSETMCIVSSILYENGNIFVNTVHITQTHPLTKVLILRVKIPQTSTVSYVRTWTLSFNWFIQLPINLYIKFLTNSYSQLPINIYVQFPMNSHNELHIPIPIRSYFQFSVNLCSQPLSK